MTTIAAFIARHPVATYFALTYAISWGGFVFVVGPGGFPGTGSQFDALLPLVRATLAGDPPEREVVVQATNRRGRTIECRVTCSPLLSATNEIDGAIVLMEEADAPD